MGKKCDTGRIAGDLALTLDRYRRALADRVTQFLSAIEPVHVAAQRIAGGSVRHRRGPDIVAGETQIQRFPLQDRQRLARLKPEREV